MNIKLNISEDGISKYLKGMLTRTRQIDGWLNRVAYPSVIRSQRLRWQSEGSSEDQAWRPLSPAYAKLKLRKFRDYPGSGRKMLIATGKLVDSVTGDDQTNHYKLVSGGRLETGTTLGYARYVDEARNFTTLSQETIDDLKLRLKKYLTGK